MRLSVLLFLFALVFALPAAAVNPLWVRLDKKLIGELNALAAASPARTEHYFKKGLVDAHSLGFGWTSRACARSGGYISVRATFYYRRDSLVSYVLYPGLPDEPALRAAYAKWYAPAFSRTPQGLAPWYHNEAALGQPLAPYRPSAPAPARTPALARYMSPESGVEYGDYRGEALTMLANRQAFRALQDSLSAAEVLLVMHAVNPASRLTAIEYYLNHPKRLAEYPPMAPWIETVLEELPEVESMQGCMGGKYNARALLAALTSPD